MIAVIMSSRNMCLHARNTFHQFWCGLLLDEDIEAGDIYDLGYDRLRRIEAVQQRLLSGDVRGLNFARK